MIMPLNPIIKTRLHKQILAVVLFLFSQYPVFTQSPGALDTMLNNLVHADGYVTGRLGELSEVKKKGSGPQSMILVPGWGFDASVFDDWTGWDGDRYTYYTITIPGFGQTPAPPMPERGTSYGEQIWTRAVVDAIARLIVGEKLNKPVIVGHFTLGAQIALRTAIDHPDRVGGLIVVGGPARFIPVRDSKAIYVPLNDMTKGIDGFWAPKWYKMVTKATWDRNNYLPTIYSLDSNTAKKVWSRSAAVPMPVMIQYFCEFAASDVTLELGKIKCPTLILRPMFDSSLLAAVQDPNRNYARPQFIDAWDSVAVRYPKLVIKNVERSATFVWKDQPERTKAAVREFMEKVMKKSGY